MGPRPDGRGKNSAPPCMAYSAGVNGAAARRPRKVCGHALPCGCAWRQWGRGQTAAESGHPGLCAGLVLGRQWGRGQTAAERGAAQEDPDCRQGASMGPRPDGRGKHLANERPPHVRWRQWGRGQTAAESVAGPRPRVRPVASMGPRPDGRGKSARPKDPLRRCRGVNGAAARRPRKACGRVGPLVGQRRQWGRGQTAAESRVR